MSLRKRQSGVAAVEFAISVPVVLFVMFAVAEIGRAFTQYSELMHAVRNATREVAGRAALGTSGVIVLSSQLQTEARNLVVFGNPAGSGAPILPNLSPGQITVSNLGGGNVSVRAQYPYQPLLGSTIRTFGFGSAPSTAWTFRVTTTMRAL